MSNNFKIRWGWLKFMYVGTFFVAGGSGLAMLIVPEMVKALFKWPVNEPVIFGIYGSILATYGFVALLGLRSPLKFLPVLLFHLCYKSLWFIGVILPLVITGKFPPYAIALCIIFAIAIVGDIIAIPFPYVFAELSEQKTIDTV
jgi:hypothetical protein